MKVIVIAEKPSVGRELARVLKCNAKHQGYFEGKDAIVTWALGHLVTLAEPGDYDARYKHWSLADLPILPDKMKLKVIPNSRKQFNTVRSLLKRGDISQVIIATDAGREGELVARWILVLGGWKKDIKRLWISSQTDAAIRDGFSKLRPGKDYDNLYHAAQCRAEADWLIGLNVTRALTCKFDAQLSAGRVQSPTLAMMIDRENEIRNFKPEPFWTVVADFSGFTGTWRNAKNNERIFDPEFAQKLVGKVSGKMGKIVEIETKKKSTQPPLLFDLTELQRAANNRFGFTAKHTLSIVQSLYERHKVVTYPRTDSRYLTTDMVPTLNDRLKAVQTGSWASFASNLLQSDLRITKRIVNDAKVSDHHALIPTEQRASQSQLTTDEKRIYDLVVRRFLAALYDDYKYQVTDIVLEIEDERFTARGKTTIDNGWKVVEGKGDEESEDDALPAFSGTNLKKCESVKADQVRLIRHSTKPPSRYTEATLLSAMENAGKFIDDKALKESIAQGGLGTPATRAEIIEKLVSTYYIERQGKALVPTVKGFQLIDLVPEELKSPELTAQWEMRLNRIAKGEEKPSAFIGDIRDNAVRLTRDVVNSTSEYKPDNLTKHKCPVCGKPLMKVQGKKGGQLICSDSRCGYRADRDDPGALRAGKRSKKEMVMNRKMIQQYSDNVKSGDFGETLGDLLDQAIKKKK